MKREDSISQINVGAKPSYLILSIMDTAQYEHKTNQLLFKLNNNLFVLC